jgi:hypothetical protein
MCEGSFESSSWRRCYANPQERCETSNGKQFREEIKPANYRPVEAARQASSDWTCSRSRGGCGRQADVIFVIQDGAIIETGKHEELIQEGGLYAEFHQLQIRSAEEQPAANVAG